MGNEIIFYNGFNMLVDIILCTAVGLLVHYNAKRHYVSEGISKAMNWIDTGVLFKVECEGEDKWTFDPTKCICDGCVPAPDNVTQLFSTIEAD